MYPEDRVLVGVINTKRDLQFARDEGWYRIPQDVMPQGIYAEYLAFFLSGKVFKEQSGSIAFYARRGGVELVRRKDLIPAQTHHKRAERLYYRLGLKEFTEKVPPISNSTNRPISFIHTTWDRFVQAKEIRDLYSDADYFVDRIFHTLRSPKLRVEHYWHDGWSTRIL